MIYKQIQEEQHQQLPTRQRLYEELESSFGLPIVAYYTSFRYPVMIENADADLLQEVLQGSDGNDGFALMISSPGGDGLAAERIINICKAYSGSGKYVAIVPGKAKSAATMVCLGASKITMGKTSELGPIDPQVVIYENGKPKGRYSVYNLVKSYEKLFADAVREKGHLEPYLQQLSNYDARQIEEFRSEMELSKDIAVKWLKSGMMKKASEAQIKKKIAKFLTPEQAKVHGRPIYANEAMECGLDVNVLDIKDDTWKAAYNLHCRLNNFVSTNGIAKCVETKKVSATMKYNAP